MDAGVTSSVAERASSETLDRKPVLVIMHGEASSPGRIGHALKARGHCLDCRKPRFGCTLPERLDEHAGVVVFGGPMSCNDTEDYIRREIDFVGRVVEAGVPFLGVCLGAQMLAKVLGAPVSRHPQGKVEIGYHPIEPMAAGRDLGPWPQHVYQWHREGLDLPTGATRLAVGPVFENQAFAFGRSAYGIQFHPEITYSLVNRWTVMAKDWVDRDGAQSREAQLASHLLYSHAVRAWLERLIDRWLAAETIAAV
jgi:GMP synthase (glutamine-hydrolysing)